MKTIKIAVTGAAGQIGYALLFRIASGQIFGDDTKVELQLLELEQALPALKGVCMELEDCAFPLLASILTTSDASTAFSDADWALLLGSVPRKQGMERSDLLKINGGIFVQQGESIAKKAKPDCRVLVVGNPCNSNALVARSSAAKVWGGSSENKQEFFAMTMLDQNRAISQIAMKAGVRVSDVRDLVIWGNHSSTMFPDFFHARIQGEAITSRIDENWLKGEFINIVQKRGSAIIEARGASSAASAANAVVDTVRNIACPTGKQFSLALASDGSYNIPEGIIFSFPICCSTKGLEIVQGLEHGEFAQKKLTETCEELLREREALQYLL